MVKYKVGDEVHIMDVDDEDKNYSRSKTATWRNIVGYDGRVVEINSLGRLCVALKAKARQVTPMYEWWVMPENVRLINHACMLGRKDRVQDR